MNQEFIPVPSMGTILKEEFLEPLGISAYRLAKDIRVPTSRILEILHDDRALTVDTALRFSHYFGMSDRYFIDLQINLDIIKKKQEMQAELALLPTYRKHQHQTLA